MARPREFESDEVAEGLLDAFWLHGVSRASIADLSAATGLLPGSLYAAFGSKDAMFALAARRYIAKMRSALDRGGSGLAGIRAILDAVVRLTDADPERRGCLLINAIPETAALSAAARGEVERGLREMRALLRQRLREAAPRQRGRELERLAALLYGAAVAIRVLGRAGHARRLLQEIADGAVAAASVSMSAVAADGPPLRVAAGVPPLRVAAGVPPAGRAKRGRARRR